MGMAWSLVPVVLGGGVEEVVYGIYDFVRRAVKSVLTKPAVSANSGHESQLKRTNAFRPHLFPETLPAVQRGPSASRPLATHVLVEQECSSTAPPGLRRI